MYIYIYIIYIHICVYVYVYVYSMHICISHIYIYISYGIHLYSPTFGIAHTSPCRTVAARNFEVSPVAILQLLGSRIRHPKKWDPSTHHN